MKNVINYFYNINIDNIRMIEDNYYFVYQGNNFIFQKINDDQLDYQDVYELNKILINNNKEFYKIILNKDSQIITFNNNLRYILMMENIIVDRKFDFLDLLDTNIVIDKKDGTIEKLNRSNWVNLWSKKIDYFEFCLNSNIHNYNRLKIYANYFIGMGENAINYAKNASNISKPTYHDKLVVSHKRIYKNYTLKDLYNPIYLVLDHPSRDISEYLKMIFLDSSYKDTDIKQFIDEVSFSKYGAMLLLSRMLFPSFFFDDFEKMTANKLDEKKCLSIIDRMNEYEQYVFLIYKLLKSRYDIPEIEWLKKIENQSTFMTPSTSGISLINIDSIPSFSVTSIMLQ